MAINPYLFFEGRAEEAAQFYQGALGAEVEMMLRYKDSPDQGKNENKEGCGTPMPPDKVMHMSLRVGDDVILGSDGMCSGKLEFKGISLSLTAQNDAQAEKFFNALAKEGKVLQPLQKTFFASSFGMLGDKFGVMWMIYVPTH